MLTRYKIFKTFIKIIIASTLTALILLIATLFYLRQDPTALAQYISEKIIINTNMSCQFSTVEILIFPLPALKISDLQLNNSQLDISMKYVTIFPSITAMLQGELKPLFIKLAHPKIKANMGLNTLFVNNNEINDKNKQKVNELKKIFLEKIASLEQHSLILRKILTKYDNLNIKIINANLYLTNDIKEVLQINSLDANISFQEPATVDGQISAKKIILRHKKQELIKLENIEIDISDNILALQQNLESSFKIQSKILIPNLLDLTNVNIYFEKIKGEKNALVLSTYEIKGRLFWHKKPISLALSGEIEELTNGNFTLEDGLISLDKDELTINAKFSLPFFKQNNTVENKESFAVDGNVTIKNLNLVQWFEFARLLPAGLQNNLSELSGLVEFSLDSTGLKIPQITAKSMYLNFTGNGKVANWSKPVIYLSLHSKSVDIPKVFPESIGIFNNSQTFAHQALVPVPATDKAQYSSIPDINYDIQLNFDAIKYTTLKAGKSSLRCLPSKNDNIDLIVYINKLYKGKAKANIEFFPSEHNKASQIVIKAQLQDILLKEPASALKIKQKIEGKLSANFDFKAKADSIKSFLASLDGKAKIKVDNAKIYDLDQDKKSLSFDILELYTKTNAANKVTKKNKKHKNNSKHNIEYNAKWLLDIQSKHINAGLELNGAIFINYGKKIAISFNKIPLKLNLNLDKSVIYAKRNLYAKVSGLFSFNSENAILTTKKYQLLLEQNMLTGKLRSNLDMNNFNIESTINLKGKNFKSILKLWFDNKSMPPSAFKNTYISTQLLLNSKSLSLNKLTVNFDKTKINGHIKGTFEEKPLWTFRLKTSNINFDKYYPKTAAKKSIRTKPLDLSLLKKIDAKGVLTFNNITIKQIKFNTLTIPITCSKAIVECSPIKAKLYKSYASGIFRLTANKNAIMQASIKATHLDMLPLTTDQNYNVLVGGRASFDLIIQGDITSIGKILNSLSADLQFNITNGFLQDKAKKGQKNNSRSKFNYLLGSVTLSKGILYNNDFKMRTDNTSITGKGWINLVTQKIDYTAYVKLPLLSIIPVHYHGDLNKPKRDVGSGSGITSILTSIGSQLFDLTHKVFSGIFSIFALQ